MKQNLLILFLFFSLSIFSQAPGKINYQGIARDASGAAISAPIDLQFVIKDNSSTTVHSETQTGIQPNQFGIFSTQIGLSTAISPTVTWKSGPYSLEVSLKSGSTFTLIGSQQLVSVPYALYAEQAGNAIPTGTINGQTLYWDNTSSAPSWKVDNNLTNDGSHVGIGVFSANSGNKLRVTSINPTDSSAIFAAQLNAKSKDAAMRALSVGNSPQNNNNPLATGIYGGQFFGVNTGNGLAVGAYGQSLADSLSVGLIGIGTTTTLAGKAVGLFASAPLSTGDNYAAIFDKGKVLIKDSLFFDNSANPGLADYVLTRSSTGKARWKPAGASNSLWYTPSASVTALQSPSNYVGIGTSSPLSKLTIAGTSSSAGFPYINSSSTKLSIHNSDVTNSNYASLVFTTLNSSSLGNYSSSEIVSENIDHINTKGNLIFLTREPSNISERMRINWDGKVGIGASNPTENLQVETNGITSLGIISSSNSNLYFGTSSSHTKGSIQYNNSSNTMSFGTNNNPNFYIDQNGLIGLKTTNLGIFDLSIYNPGTTSGIKLFNSSSTGNGLVIQNNSTSANIISYDNTPLNFGNGNGGQTFMTASPSGNVGLGLNANPSPNSRLAIKNGHFQSQQTLAPVITGSNNATAIFWGGQGTDVTGIIEITTNTVTLAGVQASVTFNKVYNSTPIVIITPANNQYAAIAVTNCQVYVKATTTGFTINFNTAYPGGGTPYTMYFNYIVIEGN